MEKAITKIIKLCSAVFLHNIIVFDLLPPQEPCMKLELVYRALRKISYWTVHGFYSEVHIEDDGNLPRKGPLIMSVSFHYQSHLFNRLQCLNTP